VSRGAVCSPREDDALRRPRDSRNRLRMRQGKELRGPGRGGPLRKYDYDVIAVGGGLGGATIAKAMTDHGKRALPLERETEFKDRVRGEVTWPWGVAELRELGIGEDITRRFAREAPWLDTYFVGTRTEHRDLLTTGKRRLPALNWVHREMEEGLLQAALKAGAEVRRGARVAEVTPGQPPKVTVESGGRVEELQARFVVCADGRRSASRRWVGFEEKETAYGMLIAGVLLDAAPLVPPDANHWLMVPGSGHFAFLSPQSDGRLRAYAWHPRERGDRFQGVADLPRFVEESVKAGVPEEWYAGTRVIGPLATFDGTDNWVDHPYRGGVALIGDAAGSNDPSYGQGQSLTLRDVRVLRDRLLESDDWDAAGHAYATEHDRYFGAVQTLTGWICLLFYTPGAEADKLRERALPLLAQDPSRMPDLLMSGPEVPLDETARRRFFGEE